jgi:transposase InsO family protein
LARIVAIPCAHIRPRESTTAHAPAGPAPIGLLNGCRYLLHDRDTKIGASFGDILGSAGIKALALPPRSPNLNAHLERWNRSVKEECLSKMILFGEASLRQVLSN